MSTPEHLTVDCGSGETTSTPFTQAELDAITAAQSAAAAAAAQAAWTELRMIRDRWLDQAQIIFARIDGANIGTLPDAIDTGITANATAWATWRQAMRDLPGNVTDPAAAVAAIRGVHSTADTWPAPWPQPPGSPLKHLT